MQAGVPDQAARVAVDAPLLEDCGLAVLHIGSGVVIYNRIARVRAWLSTTTAPLYDVVYFIYI
jgi:hypothetical protein